MKKIFVLSFFYFLSIPTICQPILQENFEYDIGNFSLVGNAYWTSSGTTDATIENGNLSYPSYPSSSIGRQLKISSSGGTDYERVVTGSPSVGTIYCSFLLSIIDQTGLSGNTAAGDYFFHYVSGNTNVSLIFIRKGTSGTTFQLGLKKLTGSTVSYNSTDLNLLETYLIVIGYKFNTLTSADDEIKLWINPDLSGTETTPDFTFTDATTDVADIDKIGIRQATNTPNAIIDGIRAATSWSQAPLPIELTSFSASVVGNAVRLSWRTETEVNNYGFDIERSLPQPLPKEGAFGTPLPLGKGQGDGLWTKIGFVNGNGNSNSPKSYTFTDTDVLSGKYSYRLKQIDNDGQFEYSKTIEVDLGAPTKFELAQNFPNPFNPETAIRFTLPTAGNVRLTIYNLLGQEVKSLVNAFKEAGTHIINFNASDFNSGVYIYKLEANGITQTRKMTLIK